MFFKIAVVHNLEKSNHVSQDCFVCFCVLASCVLIKPTAAIASLVSQDVSNVTGLRRFADLCRITIPADIGNNYNHLFGYIHHQYALHRDSIFLAPVEGAHRSFASKRAAWKLVDYSQSLLVECITMELTDELDPVKLVLRSEEIVASLMSSCYQTSGDQIAQILSDVMSVLSKESAYISAIDRYTGRNGKENALRKLQSTLFTEMRLISSIVLRNIFPAKVERKVVDETSPTVDNDDVDVVDDNNNGGDDDDVTSTVRRAGKFAIVHNLEKSNHIFQD